MSLFTFTGKSRENRMNLAHDNRPSRETILRQAEQRRVKREEDARRVKAALQIQRAARRWLSCKYMLLHFLQELSGIIAEIKTTKETNTLPRRVRMLQSPKQEKCQCMQHNHIDESIHKISSCNYCCSSINNTVSNNVFRIDANSSICKEEDLIRTATLIDRAACSYNYLRRHEEMYNFLYNKSVNGKQHSITYTETEKKLREKSEELESIQEIEKTLFGCLYLFLCDACVLAALSKHFTRRSWLFLAHVVLVQMSNSNNTELLDNTNTSNVDGSEAQKNSRTINSKTNEHTNCMMVQRTLHSILNVITTSSSPEETSTIAFFIGTMIMYFAVTKLVGPLHSTRVYLVPVVHAAFHTTYSHINANKNRQRCMLMENKPLIAVYAPTWSAACLSCLLATESEMYLSPTADAIEVLLSVHTHSQDVLHRYHDTQKDYIDVEKNVMEFIMAQGTVYVAHQYINATFNSLNANSNDGNQREVNVKNEVQFILLERLVRLLPLFLRQECRAGETQNECSVKSDECSALHVECEEVQEQMKQMHERQELLLKRWLTCIAILTQQQSHSELFIRSILFDLHYSRVTQGSKVRLDNNQVEFVKENDISKCTTSDENNTHEDSYNGAVVKGTYRYLISYLFSEHGGIQLLEQLAHQSRSKQQSATKTDNVNASESTKKDELEKEEEEEYEEQENSTKIEESHKVKEGSTHNECNVATSNSIMDDSSNMSSNINKPTEFKSAFELACDIYAWPLLSFMLTTSPQLRLETAAIFTKLVHTTHLVQLLWHLYRDTNPALRLLLISTNDSLHTNSSSSSSCHLTHISDSTEKTNHINSTIAEALKSNDFARVISSIPTGHLRRLCQRAMAANTIVRIPHLPHLWETFTPETMSTQSIKADRNTLPLSHASSVMRQRQRAWRLLYQERNPSLAVLFFTIYNYYIDVTNVREDLQANNVLALHESWALILVLKEIVHRSHLYGVLPHSGSAEVAHMACVLLSKLHIINEASLFVPFPSLWLSAPELVTGRGSSSMANDLWNAISQVREEEEAALAESHVHDEDMLAQHLTLANTVVPSPTINNNNTRVEHENSVSVNRNNNIPSQSNNIVINGQTGRVASSMEHTTQDNQHYYGDNNIYNNSTYSKEDEMFRGSMEWSATQRMARLMVHAPFLVPFPERAAFLTFYLIAQQPNVYAGFFDQLIVHREHVFADAFVRFRGKADSDAMFNVRFADENDHLEEGYGQGVYREYLASLCNEGFAPEYGLFSQTEDGRVYPNPFSFETTGDVLHLEKISFLGAMVGRALRDGVLQTVPFALPFCNSLLGRRNSINNLKSFDDELYKQLMFLTTLSEEEMAEMGLTFTYTINALGVTREVELIQGGAQVRVDSVNCLHYIHLVADFKLNREGAKQVKAFQYGLESIISQDWLKLFDSNELLKLFCGDQSGAIDIDDWERNTTYDNDSDVSSVPVRLFWEVVRSLTTEQQSKLLRFATSLRRPPLLGFRFLSPPFKLLVVPSLARDRLPSASTCFSLLKLPVYDSFAIARAKIIAAIEETNTFEVS